MAAGGVQLLTIGDLREAVQRALPRLPSRIAS